MKSFSIPIFGCRVFFTKDRDEAQEWLDKGGFDDKLVGCEGMCAGHNGRYMIFAERPDTLAHESYHAARSVLDFIGDQSGDEEVVAHLLQHIFKQCSS